jgi:hypothetical protein
MASYSACDDRPLGETQRVGALGVLGAAATFVVWQLVARVYLALEALEEGFAGWAGLGWAGAGAAVTGASPGDLGCYLLVDVLRQVAPPPVGGCG